ncbi:MAG: DUF2336 domain-containing protein [Rhodospirillales bacterium]|nr:DUF2336 domain-containing protein [Rhodospirillales bacterium]
MDTWFRNLFKGGSGTKSISYQTARKLARDTNPAVRRELAGRDDVAPEILFFLADDPEPEVRQAIAANQASPAHADRVLAGDADQEVRGALAEKIARLAPGLSADVRDKVGRLAHDTLEALARDQVTRVRRILAEALKDVAHAPPEVIRRLARDAEAEVSSPVLQFSPLLTDADLLEIIASNPVSARLCAISRRDGVNAPVADAIAGSNDTAAIGALLANPTAQIREQVLDQLIDRAESVEIWHVPLVHRPRLPAGAVAKLARFVADGLLKALQDRRDLTPKTMDEVRRIVDRRLRRKGPHSAGADGASPEDALKMAIELQCAGKLDEPMIGKAVRTGDREFAIAALAVRSGLPADLIRKVVGERNAKGMVAITWKAGFSAKLAETLQLRLAQVNRRDILAADGANYPLAIATLEFQIDFLRKAG